MPDSDKRLEQRAEGIEYYSPNNKIENLIDTTLAVGLAIGIITSGYTYKVQELTSQACQIANNIYQYLENLI
ncbi:MAG: hypothetical protein AABX54_01070 [Nanoarchaeota archaeon]